MKKLIQFGISRISILLLISSIQNCFAQSCKSNSDLDTVKGKYLTAAQYPWPAVKAEYFKNMTTTADKAVAKQVLGKIETIEQESHTSFNLTGGNWENIYYTKGYSYLGNTKLGQYYFSSSLHEFFCLNGKLKRNDESGTILRIYINEIPVNTLTGFLDQPFGSSFGDYDFGFQYMDWKNHTPTDVNAQLVTLFSYLSCSNTELIDAVNSGNSYFQDVAEKDIKPNNRNNYIYRYWFVKTKDIPVLVPVSRKEYLESLLEYYEREKLYFLKLLAQLNEEHSNSIKQYSSWETDVTDKIAVVKKALNDHDNDWLSAQAVINRTEDAAQTYKAGLKERTNYNRFWKFYDKQSKSVPLFKYNPAYFKNTAQSPAKPQLITIAFRYVSMPSSLRILNNFTKKFDFTAVKKILD